MDRITVALVVNEVTKDLAGNLSDMVDSAAEAADGGAVLAMFPEAALTGLVNNDDPKHDLPFGQKIPGPVTDALCALTREKDLWLATGLLERDGDELYDSAVLVDPTGTLVLKHRRLSSGWHGRKADPSVYRQGLDLPRARTPLGSTAVLICGDLFDDDVARRVGQVAPDCLLVPIARSFEDGSRSQEQWDAEEPAYAARAKKLGATVLLVNYVAGPDLDDDDSFGGAAVIAADGRVVSRLPIGEPGMLLVDVPVRNSRS